MVRGNHDVIKVTRSKESLRNNSRTTMEFTPTNKEYKVSPTTKIIVVVRLTVNFQDINELLYQLIIILIKSQSLF